MVVVWGEGRSTLPWCGKGEGVGVALKVVEDPKWCEGKEGERERGEEEKREGSEPSLSGSPFEAPAPPFRSRRKAGKPIDVPPSAWRRSVAPRLNPEPASSGRFPPSPLLPFPSSPALKTSQKVSLIDGRRRRERRAMKPEKPRSRSSFGGQKTQVRQGI